MASLRNHIPAMGQLVAFEASARLGNFTHAAAELCVSQAAVSRQVRELEARLGVQLFTRHRYDVCLTDAGRQFEAAVRPSLWRLADAVQDVGEYGTNGSSLTIYSDLSIDVSYLLPRLREFLAPHPDVQLNLISSGVPIEQTTARFHVGFQIGPVQSDKFDTVALSDGTIFAVCSPDFLVHNPDAVTPQSMAKMPLLFFEQPGRTWLDWDGFLSQFNVKYKLPKKRLTFTSYPSLLHAAENGDGLALGWDLSVSSRLDAGTLARAGEIALPALHNLHAYFPRAVQRKSLAVDFVNWLHSQS